MNAKIISIVLSVLVVLTISLPFIQRAGYKSKALDHYTNTTQKLYDASYGSDKKPGLVKMINSTIDDNYKSIWALACEALQTVKTSQDQARLESKYFPSIKGSMSLANMTRKFDATSDYYIVSKFSKVEEKNGVKSLAGLVSVNVNALTGNPGEEIAEEEEGEEGAEEAVEEAPAPKKAAKPAKAAKGKKGKKGKKR